ncbi:hypothetical protein KAJ89_03295 [Candidatus Parcubacteria bacterium]|nr:hypothetical protein [Candidatus Parcubacteria bacterium]
MAKLNRKQLEEALTNLNVTLPGGNSSNKDLEKLLKKVEKEKAKEDKDKDEDEDKNEDDSDGEEDEDEDNAERLSSDSGKKDEEDDSEKDKDKDEDEDYLLQYQYGKDDKGPFKYGDPRSNPAPGSKADRMKKGLLKQPQVNVMIPLADGENPDIRLSVNLNGYRLDLPKNTYCPVPKQIAEVVMDSQKQQAKALKPFLIDRNKNTEEALS